MRELAILLFLSSCLAAASVAERPVEIRRDGKIVARIHPSPHTPDLGGLREARAFYSELRRGARLGTIEIVSEWTDYRGRVVPPGRYELLYAVQPLLKDHAGTSRWRDFAILAGGDDSGHPLVMALVPPDEPPPDGERVVPIAAGDLTVALVVEGIGEADF